TIVSSLLLHPICMSTSFFLHSPASPRHLHSFPTRRSSDLRRRAAGPIAGKPPTRRWQCGANRPISALMPTATILPPLAPFAAVRSEEHTSELQSRENLVCRLLLEKKKKKKRSKHLIINNYE